MAQQMKRPLGQIERQTNQPPRLDQGLGGQFRNRRDQPPRRHRRQDGLVGRQGQNGPQPRRDAARQGRLELAAGARPLFAQGPIQRLQLSRRQRLAPPRQRMPRRRHHHQPVGVDPHLLDPRHLERPLDQAQFGLSRQHGFHHPVRVADIQMQVDRRMAPRKGRHARRQPVGGDGLAGEQPHRAALQPRQIVQHPLRRLGLGQHRPRLGQKGRPGRVQGQAPAHPVEQPGPVPRLQGRDRRADRRLGQAQRLGRPRHVQTLGHGDEDAKLFQGHGQPIASIDH